MPADPSRTGTFGRRPGPDAPPPVPFVKVFLPGVSFVKACVAAGQAVGRVKEPAVRKAVRQESDADRKAAIIAAIRAIAAGRLAPASKRTLIVGKQGQEHDTVETCAAIVRAFTFLHKHNPPQESRYIDRCAGEADRALANGRAGENPLGWTDAGVENADAIKRASDDLIAAAAARKAARSGVNAPTAKYRAGHGAGSPARVTRRAAVKATAAAAATGGKRRGAKSAPATPAATPARKGEQGAGQGAPVTRPTRARGSASETSTTKGAPRVARRPNRPGKGA